MARVSGPVTADARAVEKLIESSPTKIKEIIEKLRSVAKASMPGADEFVYHDAINYKLPQSPSAWICYIATHRDYARLGFYFGASLSDPKKLVEGTGKRMRHVKVRTVAEASEDALADLIREAWTAAVANMESATRRQTEDDQS
jgi:hypothetical protein